MTTRLSTKKHVAKLSVFLHKVNRLISSLPKLPRWSQHVLFWAFIAYATNSQLSRQFAPTPGLIPNTTGQYVIWINHILLSVVSFWALGYYVMPRFWHHNKPVQTASFFGLYWFLSCWETEQVFDFVATHYTPIPRYVDGRVTLFRENSWLGYFLEPGIFWFNWAHNFSYVLIPLLIKSTRDETSRAEKILALEQDKLLMELSFLRSQINPHFLFNAFNNLYGLIRKGDRLAANVLADLSDIMRYALYKTKADYVPLRGELHFLANYLRIEGIRFPVTKNITCEVDGDPGDFGIPPMIIVPFVENAFKHGLNSSLTTAYLTIHIVIDPQSAALHLLIINSKEPGYRPGKDGGIGIVNVRKRLDLLFNTAYRLQLTDKSDTYTVDLSMPLVNLTPSEVDPEQERLPFPYHLHEPVQSL